VGDKPLQVSASIGVATARQASTDPAALLRQADTALYEAKHKGRNRWEMYDETLHHRAFEREAIEVDLRSAAASGLFRLYYQPIFDVHDGRLLGAEALLRLAHPTRGLLEPGAFIRVAEDSDLIGGIGDWVLKQACLQLAQWNPGGGFRVGVNVCRRELSDRGFANRVLGAAGDAGINPVALSLEMTEGTLIEGGTPIVNELRRLSGAGVGLAVDDFGTGYCSLSYLQRFPIDTVKIDGSVVAGLGVSRHGSAIVEAVTALSHTLDLAAVAEGVETPEQLEALRNLGCPRAQGFLLGRPVPPLEFAPLLAARDSHAHAATPDLRAGADTYVHQGRPL
jgi:EAL domain-containing protein (putative c-di-GMP-specific phosphodiesterase class I)